MKGLSEQEARARRERGEGNAIASAAGRSYLDIARANVFNFFNAILIAIGTLLVALGRAGDALISIGPLFLANSIVRTAQEAYAKHKLDRIALAGRAKIAVVRDGKERPIDPSEIVRGDLLRVRAGDAVVADGPVVEGVLEADESLLSGESDPVAKRVGDALLSGSFCVSGDALYEAERVADQSYAGRLTAAARRFEVTQTPLQAKIDFVVRIVIVVVAFMSALILLAGILEGLPSVRLVQIAAVLTALVPYGLFFMTIVAYALSAALISGKGVVLQQVSAVESLSNVDVLCMDKTGTLTANRLRYRGLFAFGARPRDDVERLLGCFARSGSAPNRTAEAIAAGIPGGRRAPRDEVAFSSSRGWSALAFDPGDAYVLGALEALGPFLPPETLAAGTALSARVREWADAGLRVLVFAENPDGVGLRDAQGRPCLPALALLAAVALGDELRPDAAQTIAEFGRMGIEAKIISGDDPRTVAALARQAGLAVAEAPVSGSDLAHMSDHELARAAATATIFGRVDPRQKEKLIDTLVAQGRYVAMIGDGVNDVLALKKARLAIAMGSGSDAARRVADMVLSRDSFAALRPAFREGKRVVAGLTRALCLFMTRASVAALLIAAISILQLGFPFEPGQLALSYLTAGIPSFFLILWAQPEERPPELLHALARFVIPAALVTVVLGVALYVWFYVRVTGGFTTYHIPDDVIATFESYTGLSYSSDGTFTRAAATIVAQTAMSLFITVTALLQILFVEPPAAFFAVWTEGRAGPRPALLAAALFACLVLMVAVPGIARHVALFPLGPGASGAIALAALVWTLALRAVWRARLYERFLRGGK